MKKSYKMDFRKRTNVLRLLTVYENTVRTYRFLVCDFAESMYGNKIIDAPHTHSILNERERKYERIAVLHNNRAYYLYNSNFFSGVCDGLVKAGLA